MGMSSSAIGELTKELKEAKEQNRRERYRRLKAEGRLPTNPAIGRGFPEVVTYAEWDGQTAEEYQEMVDYYEKIDRGRLTGW